MKRVCDPSDLDDAIPLVSLAPRPATLPKPLTTHIRIPAVRRSDVCASAVYDSTVYTLFLVDHMPR